VAFLAGRLRRLHESQRRSQERRYEALLAQSSDVTILVDEHGTVEYVSRGIERVLGIAAPLHQAQSRPWPWPADEEESHRSLAGLLHPEDVGIALPELRRLARQPGRASVLRSRMRRADGTWADVEAIGRNLLGDPDVNGLLFAVRDVTDRRELERELERRATHDELTGLRNRFGLFEQLSRAHAETGDLALLFCDLDRFKDVNDELGHRAGDALLQEVALRLANLVPGDHTIARLGGDEFGVLLRDVDQATALGVAEAIAAELRRPVTIDDREVTTSVSVGVAITS
jgi:diguanylate cyclase (GGDEF)-like protein/PAS domain S-box-containing protein